jgi:hypothetical protein
MFATPVRLAALAAVLGFSALPASAGGICRDCYRQVVEPPAYQTSAESVLLQGPRTGAIVTPPEYSIVRERVQVVPARRIWQVSIDPWGRKVGCWVTLPGRTEWRNRRIISRAAEVEPVIMPTVYGLRQTTVMVAPARLGWEPIGSGYDFRVESVVSGY